MDIHLDTEVQKMGFILSNALNSVIAHNLQNELLYGLYIAQAC